MDYKKLAKVIILSALTTLALFSAGCDKNGADDKKDDFKTEVPAMPTVPKHDPYKTAGWYAKTEVSAIASDGTVYSHKTAGVFGELVQSSDQQDQHDIPSYGASILQVLFLPAFSSGTYFSDYRHYDASNAEKQVWTFQVKNQQTVDLSNAPINISLAGAFDVKYRDDNGAISYKESKDINQTRIDALTLIDVDNQTEYTAAQLPTANLTMDGLHTRTFRWVLGTVDSTDYEALSSPQRAAGRSAITLDFKAAAQQKSGSKFGLPPQ